MSHESFDPSKYKNVAEMPKEEQENFEVVPTAPDAPEAFVMASAVAEQKRERVAAEAEEIRAIENSIRNIPDEITNDEHLINDSINRLSYYSNNNDKAINVAPVTQEDDFLRARKESFDREQDNKYTTTRRGWSQKDAEDEAWRRNRDRGVLDTLLNRNVDSLDILREEAKGIDNQFNKKIEEHKIMKEDLAKATYDQLLHKKKLDDSIPYYAPTDGLSAIDYRSLMEEIEKREEVRKDEKTGELASLLHDEWRESRKKEDGTYNPQVKVLVTTEDGKEKWFNADKVPPTAKELKRPDIANTDYENLDPYYQGENKISAEVAMGEVYKNRNVINDANREAFIEGASNVMHIKWLERNGSWAPPEQKLPYAELSEEEKEKDRVIIIKAIEIWQSRE